MANFMFSYGMIPFDPCFKRHATNYEPIKARVKPEAAAVAELGHTGLVGRLFADSMDEARRKNIENSLKEKVVPKNHIQQNIQRMRKMQKESREKRSQVVKNILNSGSFVFIFTI